MGLWRFFDYCTDDNPPKNLIQDWYGRLGPDVQAEFDAAVATLGATENWKKSKSFSQLKREHAGLSELRFAVTTIRKGKKAMKRRFRPVGIWREGEKEFLFLVGCEKAQGIYTPPNAFDLAMLYKAEYERGKGEVREHY